MNLSTAPFLVAVIVSIQETSPRLVETFKDGEERFGDRESASNIIGRIEDALGDGIVAPGFPAKIAHDEPEAPGYGVILSSRL